MGRVSYTTVCNVEGAKLDSQFLGWTVGHSVEASVNYSRDRWSKVLAFGCAVLCYLSLGASAFDFGLVPPGARVTFRHDGCADGVSASARGPTNPDDFGWPLD